MVYNFHSGSIILCATGENYTNLWPVVIVEWGMGEMLTEFRNQCLSQYYSTLAQGAPGVFIGLSIGF